MNFTSEDLSFLLETCYQAGNAIMEVYQAHPSMDEVDYKSDHSPLTRADKAAHDIIFTRLSMKYPEIPVVSEEGEIPTFETRKNWSHFWLVDPLDGTKEFIKRNGQFTVNIAYLENNLPVFGFIFAPARGEMFYSFDGKAYFSLNNSSPSEIKVSSRTSDWVAVGSSSHASEEDQQKLKSFPIVKSIPMGSSLKFCWVAKGEADIYFRSGPTMEWDTAAGHAIVLAAGGLVQNLTYNKPNLTNGAFLCLGNAVYLE